MPLEHHRSKRAFPSFLSHSTARFFNVQNSEMRSFKTNACYMIRQRGRKVFLCRVVRSGDKEKSNKKFEAPKEKRLKLKNHEKNLKGKSFEEIISEIEFGIEKERSLRS